MDELGREVVEFARRFPTGARLALFSALAVLIVSNLLMVAVQGALIIAGSDGLDWHTYQAATRQFGADLYGGSGDWWYGWRYSPIAVFPLAIVGLIGEAAWRILHFVALLALPGWTRLIAAASYPLWFDVHAGNILVFILVAAYWALRGNPWAIGGTLTFALLVPRPLLVPIVIWLLWKRPEWRCPFAILFVVHGLAVAATGYGADWLETLVSIGLGGSVLDVGPGAIFGWWWLVAAIPIAGWAFSRGYPATAGLLLQPLLAALLPPHAPRRWRSKVAIAVRAA